MAYAPQSQIKPNMFSPPKESQYLPSLNRRQKQNDFVLNCDSSEWKLPEYNSLQDNHLKFFFANPKVRSVLLQTGMIDESGNIHKDTSKINFSRSTKITAKQKLPPLPEGVNMAVQRIILPYKASRKTKNRLAKASKEQPIPIKRTISQIPTQLHTQTPPRAIQSMIARGKPLSSMRKVQPLSKDQLAQVFAKYQSNVNKPGATSGTDQSTVASDLTPNKPKQQHGNEYESEFKSSGALNSERKERTLSNEDDKKPVLSPEEPKKEEINPAINEMDDLQLVDPQDMAEEKIEEKAEEKVEESPEQQFEENPEEQVEEKAEEKPEEKIEEIEEEKAEEKIEEKVEEEVAASPQKVESNIEEDE